MSVDFPALMTKAASSAPIRVCAFGSSNTQRRSVGMHWFDHLDLGFRRRFGGEVGTFVNSGIGGHTSDELLARFDRDVASFRPDLTIITVGGNDAKPERTQGDQVFHHNLVELVDRCRTIDSDVLLQTYYACDIELMAPAYGQNFLRTMDIIREVAAETGTQLMDHLVRWEPLRLRAPEIYRLLKVDAMHVNELGNQILGLDLLRAFGLEVTADDLPHYATALFAQLAMDTLAE